MEEQRQHGVGGIATKYGLIQGVLSFGVFLAGALLPAMRQSPLLRVANLALFIVLLVLAHWELKKKQNGRMTYAQGLGSGTLLSVIAAVVSSVLLYVYVRYINPGYVELLTQTQQAALARRGITGAQAQMALGITAAITTPIGIAVISMIAGVIMGFIVALIVSIFTQKDPSAV